MRLRGYGQALWRRWYLHLVLKGKWGFVEDREEGRCSTKREQYRQARMRGDLMKFFFCYLCWHSTHSLKSLSSGCALSVYDNILFIFQKILGHVAKCFGCSYVLFYSILLIFSFWQRFLLEMVRKTWNGAKYNHIHEFPLPNTERSKVKK